MSSNRYSNDHTLVVQFDPYHHNFNRFYVFFNFISVFALKYVYCYYVLLLLIIILNQQRQKDPIRSGFYLPFVCWLQLC